MTIQGEKRTFQALTERFWDSPTSVARAGLSAPAYLHLVCSPQQALGFLEELTSLGEVWQHTKIVFEPMPYECKEDNLKALEEVLPFIDVFSPNDAEAARFLGVTLPDHETNENEYKDAVESMVPKFARQWDSSTLKAVIIRCGGMGVCLAQPSNCYRWVPAYFQSSQQGSIVDVTGAGNAFLVGAQFTILQS